MKDSAKVLVDRSSETIKLKAVGFIKLVKKDPRQAAIYGCFILLFLLSFAVRNSLSHLQYGDYTAFVAWFDFLKGHGLHGFKYGFSNYNPPYTYFLYLVTFLPISTLHAIKGLLVFFDLLLAFSVYLVVKEVSNKKYFAISAGLVTLFLPSVLLNGVFWGQFDDFYTAFIMFSLYFLLRSKGRLKSNSRWAWICFGIAIAIKLQAIFFLPVLIIMMFKRIKWYDASWAALVFAVLTFPPMLAGRSFSSIMSIYSSQTSLYGGSLSLNAPNWYQWFTSSSSSNYFTPQFQYFNGAGIFLTFGAVIFILIFTLVYKKYSKKDVLFLSALMLVMIPFLLPQMHDRYFLPSGIAIVVLAFAYPAYAWMAVMMQTILIFTYSPYLFNKFPLPLSILAMFVLLIISVLATAYLRPHTVEESKKRNSLEA